MKKYILLAKELPDGTIVRGDSNCWSPHCPAVIKMANGKAVVVGRLLSKEQHAEIADSGIIGFHEGEVGVEVSAELLRELGGKL